MTKLDLMDMRITYHLVPSVVTLSYLFLRRMVRSPLGCCLPAGRPPEE